MARPNDGMYTRFTEKVVPDLLQLTPGFDNEREARMWYSQMRKRAWFKRRVESRGLAIEALPEDIYFDDRAGYRCTAYAKYPNHYNLGVIQLPPSLQNPLQVLHILAHIIQPADSAFHKGEFSRTFLDLVERAFDTDMKRQVTDVLLNHDIRTRVVGPETRIKQRERYYKRKAEKDAVRVPEGLVRILRQAQQLGIDDDDE